MEMMVGYEAKNKVVPGITFDNLFSSLIIQILTGFRVEKIDLMQFQFYMFQFSSETEYTWVALGVISKLENDFW